jgi:hypothetical protein
MNGLSRAHLACSCSSHQQPRCAYFRMGQCKEKTQNEFQKILVDSINSAGIKLGRAMRQGPEGPGATLTPEEATVVYRILTEKLGMRFAE